MGYHRINSSSGYAANEVTTITASATAVELIAARSYRKILRIFNDSSQMLYLQLGTVTSPADPGDNPATITDYDNLIPAGEIYEYEGAVPLTALNGIWEAADPDGKAIVIEGW